MGRCNLDWQSKTHMRSSSACVAYASKHGIRHVSYGDQAMKLRRKVDQLTAKIAKCEDKAKRSKLEGLRELTVIKMIACHTVAR